MSDLRVPLPTIKNATYEGETDRQTECVSERVCVCVRVSEMVCMVERFDSEGARERVREVLRGLNYLSFHVLKRSRRDNGEADKKHVRLGV